MDKIKRYLSEDGIRLSFAITTNTVEEARFRHDTWPVVTAALGRTMTGALLLASDFKNKETVSISIDGNGPIGKIHVDALGENSIRGYVDNPHVDLPLTKENKLDVGTAVGHEGQLSVTRFIQMEQNYSSQCPLVSGEIGEDLAFYLFMSEQINSTISVGVLVGPDNSVLVTGGVLIQALPGAKDESLAKIEENLKALGPITQYLREHPNGEGLIETLTQGLTFKEVSTDEVHFKCTCNRERFLNILGQLTKKDKESLLEDEKQELVCHYCNTAYVFTKDELISHFNTLPKRSEK